MARFSWKNKITISPEKIDRLVWLAKRSLDSNDVPVASILLLDDEIIGEGFNTVLRNKAAGEHAEINAVSSAIAALGIEKFSALDRNQLVLISSFEPCLMCIGMCANYNIRHVYYLQEKERKDVLKERKLLLKYYFHRKQVSNNGEQIALFRLHPDYPTR